MPWHRLLATRSLRPPSPSFGRHWSTSAHCSINPAPKLPSWDIEVFKARAFQPALPAKLLFSRSNLPPACHKWFVRNDRLDSSTSPSQGVISELSIPFWIRYENHPVPIELTQTSPTGAKSFHRSTAPLKFFLEHSTGLSSSSLYIAQYSLTDLPSPLQSDLPTPDLVTKSGKGDIYDSSLWMGRPPTFTPLHKDPNPNLFLQLAGQKMVRVFPPEVGRAMFEIVQAKLGYAGIASFRGDEMMQGPERDVLEEVVWADVPRGEADREEMEAMRNTGFEALLDLGEALFIPKGWWHSVRGVGSGMNVSVNWWFR